MAALHELPPPTDSASFQSEAHADNVPAEYIVGIGASAGGLEAFTTFFQHMPAESGLAFILVQHLDPHQPSLLPDLIASQTLMPVSLVVNQMLVLPNHVYVIPPNTTMTIEHGVLVVVAPTEAHGHRMPIDHFMQSLARDLGVRAIGVLLSGADADGTLGLAGIQDAGGLTLAQTPDTARFATMPQSALDRQVVDRALPVQDMPAMLLAHVAQQATQLVLANAIPSSEAMRNQLHEICAIILRTSGHDFRQYKPATLQRRIARRMQLANVADAASYTQLLQHDPHELERLFQDFLISVTSFFRDPAAFNALAANILPVLIESKQADMQLRIWVAGCATGEEAYSIAMLVLEQLERFDAPPQVVIFATDIDEQALKVARKGHYGSAITSQMSAERLARFFVIDGEGYQVSRALRELCLFSSHNLIRDPPFARIDLMVCRNLMIYFTVDLQRQLMPLLHYALIPGGYLMLGAAESAAARPELFRAVDHIQRIFQRIELRAPQTTVPFPLMLTGRRPVQLAAVARREPLASMPSLGVMLEHLMVQDYTPPAVVVDMQGTIIYIFGHIGPYLEPSAGAATLNVHVMIRPELQPALQTALGNVQRTKAPVRSDAMIVGVSGLQRLTLIARPLEEIAPGAGLTLVIFQAALPSTLTPTAELLPPITTIAEQLTDALQITRAALESTIAVHQESNAELTTANEELVATNEEIQSANEELQTSKEEIQSINEELQTVNAELQRKIAELDRVNADLVNLFVSTGIPAIFLRADGRIMRFTPAATEVFYLLASDIGRPITDIASRFQVGDLRALIDQVLQTLLPYEAAIQRTEPPAWWLLRIRPYRTLANVIDGVVMAFADITGLKQAEFDRELILQDVQSARMYAEQIVATVIDPLLILDSELRVLSANPAYYQRFTTTAAATEQVRFFELSDGVWNLYKLRTQLDAVRNQQIDLLDMEIIQVFPVIDPSTSRTMRIQVRPIMQQADHSLLLLVAIADITELSRAAAVLKEAHAVLEQRVGERTHELAALNATLQAEVIGHRRSEEVREQLLQQLVTAQEEERRRVARELHDQLGQDLAGLILGLKALQDVVVIDTLAANRVRELQTLAIQMSQQVRTLAVQLRPAVLDDLGLAVALANEVEQWSARALVTVDLHTSGLDGPRMPLAVESAIYRLVQEALTNVLKHASAQSVSLIIERRTDQVRLIIEDDGIGFDLVAVRARPPAEQRLGLVGMDERVAQLGGTLTIESAPGSGTAVFITIPLAANSLL